MIRIATREDIPRLAEIMLHGDVRPYLGLKGRSPAWVMEHMARSFHEFLYLINEDGRGMLMFEAVRRKRGHYFVHVAAKPSVRGKQMIEAVRDARELLAAAGVRRIYGHIKHWNRRALSFARMVGMRPSTQPGRWKQHVYLPTQGQWLRMDLVEKEQEVVRG